MENTTWRVRVHADGRDNGTAFVRQHQFAIGAPLSFDAQYNEVSSLEYLLAALGSELTVGLITIGRQKRLRIESAEAVVTGELAHPLVYLDVIGEEGYAGLGRVAIKVYVSADEPPDVVEQLWQEMLRRLPLVNTLKVTTDLDITLQIME